MWFYETLYENIRMGIEGELLFEKKTPYQDLKIYDTPGMGRVLTLDGTIQTAEKDEFIYHEMITHPVMLSSSNPENVLIIGAGDGGVLYEVLKYKQMKKTVIVEIDDDVIQLSRKYLPSISRDVFSGNDKRVKVVVDDGAEFIRQTKEKFDLCIVDSPDPVGAAEVLFSREFYQNIFSILTDDGIMIRQTGSTMFQPEELTQNYAIAKKIFPFVSIQLAAIPTYIGGFFSFILGSKKINLEDVSYEQVKNRYLAAGLNTRYYNPEIHFASRKLPNYLRMDLE